jgi:hypothetical protein
VLHTIWHVMIVRIEDSSCWAVVAGRLSKISSSSSGIAKTSAALLMVYVVTGARGGRYHIYGDAVMYTRMSVCRLHLLGSAELHAPHGPHFQWSIEVYTANEKAVRPTPSTFVHRCGTHTAHAFRNNLSVDK